MVITGLNLFFQKFWYLAVLDVIFCPMTISDTLEVTGAYFEEIIDLFNNFWINADRFNNFENNSFLKYLITLLLPLFCISLLLVSLFKGQISRCRHERNAKIKITCDLNEFIIISVACICLFDALIANMGTFWSKKVTMVSFRRTNNPNCLLQLIANHFHEP